MNETLVKYFVVLMPLIILGIKGLLKHSVGKKLNEITYGNLILELPIDILFISISFNIIYFSKSDAIIKLATIYICCQIFIAIIAVILWRHAVAEFEKKENLCAAFKFGIINFILTIPFFILITQLIMK